MPSVDEDRPAIQLFRVAHADLDAEMLADLRRLFDREYLAEFGDWDPEQPYGYAPHDLHVIARLDGGVVGHAGWGRREIAVGDAPAVIAGVGGVLVSPDARGLRLGQRLMGELAATMREEPGLDFGYLGCDESVVPFYESCGWRRIAAAERCVDRSGEVVETPAGAPLLVLPLQDQCAAWPSGPIDLRGRPW